MLYSSLVKNTALSTLVRMTKLPLNNIRYDLVLSVRMKRPNSTRAQGIVIQNTEVSETIVPGTIVSVEGKMPPTTKSPILNPTGSRIESISRPNSYFDVFCFL